MRGKLARAEIMRAIFVCVACLLGLFAALFLPNLGPEVALLFIGFSLVPVSAVQFHFGAAINGFARAHGLNESYLTVGVAAAPLVCLGVFCLIKALLDRNAKIAALGMASLGYLGLTVLAYFRFGQAFHG
jgi:hypothetical protein